MNAIMSKKNNRLCLLKIGLTDYAECWNIQKSILAKRKNNEIDDCLIVTEHKPALTMGRGTDKKNLLASNVQLKQMKVGLYEIERGGDITFHGPGQAVFYPIIDLSKRDKDVHKYLRDLENFVIKALKEFGLTASIKPGLTGIWIDDTKIGAIGVAASKWVSYHGIAINVNTDLDYFKLINPCGITNYPVGSVSGILGKRIELDHFNDALIKSFANYFGYGNIESAEIESILK